MNGSNRVGGSDDNRGPSHNPHLGTRTTAEAGPQPWTSKEGAGRGEEGCGTGSLKRVLERLYSQPKPTSAQIWAMKDPNSPAETTKSTRRIRLDVDVDVDVDSTPRVTHSIRPLPLYPNRLTLYIPVQDSEWVKEMKTWFSRDGSSISTFLLDKLREYYRGHNPGNPQTPLERFPLDLIQQGAIIQKDPGDERWERLWKMTDEALMERQMKLLDRPGTYLERLEMSMILLQRRLNKPPKD